MLDSGVMKCVVPVNGASKSLGRRCIVGPAGLVGLLLELGGFSCLQRDGVLRTWRIIWLPLESRMGSWDDAGFSEKRKGVYRAALHRRARSDGWVWPGVVGGDCGVLS